MSCQHRFSTVVIDKATHLSRFPSNAWNPYTYGLEVLLERIKGWLVLRQNSTADVMPEARGDVEDQQLEAAYQNLRTCGSTLGFSTAAEFCASFPVDHLLFRRKEHNVAGLQYADLIAAEQKWLTVCEQLPEAGRPIGPFGVQLNAVIEGEDQSQIRPDALTLGMKQAGLRLPESR
jgi:hypothetical protein